MILSARHDRIKIRRFPRVIVEELFESIQMVMQSFLLLF